MDLIEIGKRLSLATEAQIKAAIKALQALLDGNSNDTATTEALRRLQEAEMSFDDIKTALRAALKALNPIGKRYYYIRDVYADWFVYEDDGADPVGGPTKLYKRSYAFVDGKVTLGDPVEVYVVTTYQPVGESARLAEVIKREGNKWVLYSKDGSKKLGEFDSKEAAEKREKEIEMFRHMESLTERDVDKNVGGGVDRDKIPAEDFAGKNRSFPIVTPGDVEDAAKSIGRAGSDNYDAETLKRNIIRIAKRKGQAFVAKLPDAWKEEQAEESTALEIVGDLVPLVEKAVRMDGTVPIKIIQPGWGSSGHYSKEVLQRDGPKVFKKGLHMYIDHPTPTEEAERPERSVNGLGGVLESDAYWQDDGPAGPGLYADAKVFAPFKERLDELAPHIGVSIRALGKASKGEAEGKKGNIIEAITAAKSVDFVTTPGAGGRVLQLFEAARGGQAITNQEVAQVNEQEAQALREAKAALEAENARLKEALLLREAKDFVAAELAKVEMPDITRTRLTEALAAKPVLRDGTLDKEGYEAAIKEAVKAEIEYLAKIARAGNVRGMGPSVPSETASKDLADAFRRLGLSESAAKVAAAGR